MGWKHMPIISGSSWINQDDSWDPCHGQGSWTSQGYTIQLWRYTENCGIIINIISYYQDPWISLVFENHPIILTIDYILFFRWVGSTTNSIRNDLGSYDDLSHARHFCFHVVPRILSLSAEPTVDFEPWSFLEKRMVMGESQGELNVCSICLLMFFCAWYVCFSKICEKCLEHISLCTYRTCWTIQKSRYAKSCFCFHKVVSLQKRGHSDIDVWVYFNIFTPQKTNSGSLCWFIWETPVVFLRVKLRESPGCDFAGKLGEHDRHSAKRVRGPVFVKNPFWGWRVYLVLF